MRALLGPLNRAGHRAVVADLGGLEVLTFDESDADLTFCPAREPLSALFARLPDGFTPDCLIWWSPEYSLLPVGLEDCPVPSIAVLGDWNLGLWTTAPILEAFDWVVTDRGGVRALRSQLDVPVDAWRAFSFDQRLHRRPASEDRDIDVLFVGNLNHDVQRERAPWLLRLAQLGGGRRLHLVSGVYGPGYAELLGRTRVVWNRSIRGELNMRAYEAPACGALLFMEAENLEVRDVYADGESCVLYDAQTLGARLAHALAHPEESTRIAEAGWRRVQRETYRAHFESLLGSATALRFGGRRFAVLPPWRRDYWLGLHALSVAHPERTTAALAHLLRASATTDDSAAVTAALGAVSVAAAVEAAEDARSQPVAAALGLLEAAVAAQPADVVSRINLGALQTACRRPDAARETWRTARTALLREEPFPVDRMLAPFPYDRLRVEWERASVAADVAERTARFRALLLARVAGELARLEDDPCARIDGWSEAVAAFPGIDDNVRELGAALAAAGEDAAALAAYQHVLDDNPFDWPSRAEAVRLAGACADAAAFAKLDADSHALAAALASVPARKEAAA